MQLMSRNSKGDCRYRFEKASMVVVERVLKKKLLYRGKDLNKRVRKVVVRKQNN